MDKIVVESFYPIYTRFHRVFQCPGRFWTNLFYQILQHNFNNMSNMLLYSSFILIIWNCTIFHKLKVFWFYTWTKQKWGRNWNSNNNAHLLEIIFFRFPFSFFLTMTIKCVIKLLPYTFHFFHFQSIFHYLLESLLKISSFVI